MSDARWFEIDAAVTAAVRHFAGACAIFAKIPATIGDEDRYLVEMAFMHAMLAGQNRGRSTVAGGIIVKTTTNPS
jgi:hypothetical protein